MSYYLYHNSKEEYLVVKKNHNLLKIPNINSKDAKFKELIYEIDDSLFNEDNYSKKEFEHLCVCSGGTTSSCVKDGLKTLDLRKNYSKIHLDRESNLVTIGRWSNKWGI